MVGLLGRLKEEGDKPQAVRDITESKKAEEELRESEEKFRNFLENANDLIQSVDADGRFVYVNKKWCETLGYSKDEVIRLKLTDILRKDQIPYCVECFKKIISGEAVDRIETIFVSKNGKEVVLEGTSNPLFEDGKFVATQGIFRDITERKRTEEEFKKYATDLEEANSLKDLFADIMRHDLLNPIGIVKTYSELALDSGPDIENFEELQAIKRNAEQAIKLIENATQLSKLESAKKLDFEKLDLNVIFKGVVHDFSPMLQERNLRVEYKVKGEYPARANPVIKNVFINFISNAINYTPEGTKIVIGIEDENKYWKVSVKDYGEGIPDENKEVIFERFIKGGKKGIKGTGLGLAIVKRITELHKGKVWVEDNPEGGSIFSVKLPKWKSKEPLLNSSPII